MMTSTSQSRRCSGPLDRRTWLQLGGLFDLKPEAPVEYRGPFRPIHTNVPGMEITELLPQLAILPHGQPIPELLA